MGASTHCRSVLLLALLAAAGAGAERWSPIGPSAGQADGLAAGAGTLVATTPFAGPFVSRDGGDHWHATAAGPRGTGGLGSRTVHVSSDGTIFVSDKAGELWRSRDRGLSWQSLRAAAVAVGAPDAVEDLDTATRDPAEVMAIFGGQAYQSSDGGDSWRPIVLPAGATPSQLRFDPHATSRRIASTLHGVLWSDDAGSSWQVSNLDSPHARVALEPGYRGRVYASVNGSDPRLPRGTIYLSLDRGRSFVQGATLAGFAILAVDPTVAGGLVALDFVGQVHRSTNAGRSFVRRATLRRGVFALTVDRAGTVYAVTTGGPYGRSILRSKDHGATFTPHVAGLEAATVLALAPSPDGARWWAGFGPSELGAWTLDDDVWRLRGLRRYSVTDLSVHPVLAGEVLAATGGGIARTVDGGATWTTAASSGLFATAVDRDPSEPRHVLAAVGGHAVVSRDGGVEWTPLPSVDIGPLLRFARDGSAFYASLGWIDSPRVDNVDALVRIAADGTSRTNMLTVKGKIEAILEPVESTQGLWVATTAFDGTALHGTVFQTTDGGLQWHPRALPDAAPAFTLAAEPGAHGKILVGSAGAVYASTDSGKTWTALGDGLPRGLRVTALALGGDGHWRAGTAGGGVFVLSDD